MDCAIRVINGPDQGRECRIASGANLIGRGSRAALQLTPEDVSWEHAVILREGEDYYIENLSALGTWVGDARISGKVRLRPRDKVRLTEQTVLRLEPADGKGGALAGRGFLAGAVIVMLALLAGVAFYQFGPSSPSGGNADWNGAYGAIVPYLQRQAASRHVPPEMLALFREAWRIDQAKNYSQSNHQWLRLQVMLAAEEGRLHAFQQSTRHPTALDSLLHPSRAAPTLDDEQSAAALAQFIKRRLDYSAKVGESSVLNPN